MTVKSVLENASMSDFYLKQLIFTTIIIYQIEKNVNASRSCF